MSVAAFQRRGLASALASAVLLLVPGACSAPPGPQAPAAPRSAWEVNQRITVQDRTGAVPSAVKQRDLARLRAEGRGAWVQRHLNVLTSTGDVNLYRGNAARLLVDGPATLAAMKAAISSARHRVLLESYIIEDDGVAAEFAALLTRKAKEGVSVALLYDSIGSLETDAAFFQHLRESGVAVCEFNPVNPLERPGYWGLVERSHRKLLVVDADLAYTGGINLSNVYAQGSHGSGAGSKSRPPPAGVSEPDNAGWRDTQIELRGPAVTAMALVFRNAWLDQGCPGALEAAPAPRQATAGERVVIVVAGDPAVGVNPTYTALLAAVDASVHSVHLTMAYFAPGPDMVLALCEAAERGVDVSLVLPGRSDVTLVMHAARSYYQQLLKAGVKIHEMTSAVMHAKTAVIDGVFSSVGSSNLDWRSIVGNHEVDVIVLGDDFGDELEALFTRDLAASTAIDAERWSRRGLGQRLMERVARLLEPLL